MNSIVSINAMLIIIVAGMVEEYVIGPRIFPDINISSSMISAIAIDVRTRCVLKLPFL